MTRVLLYSLVKFHHSLCYDFKREICQTRRVSYKMFQVSTPVGDWDFWNVTSYRCCMGTGLQPSNTKALRLFETSRHKARNTAPHPKRFYLLHKVLPEKLTGPQLLKKFPALNGNQRFITAITNALHLSLSWARTIQFMPHPTSQKSILILSSLLHLGLPSGSFLQVFPSKPSMHLYSPPYVLHAPAISVFLIWSPK